jgi:hypothetical protein
MIVFPFSFTNIQKNKKTFIERSNLCPGILEVVLERTWTIIRRPPVIKGDVLLGGLVG